MFVSSQLIVGLINFFVALAELLLGLRVILKLLAANPATPFVNWIYEASGTLLQPFRGMFPARSLEGGSTLDFSAIFAIVIYALAGYLLIELIDTVEAAAKNRKKSKK